MAKNSETVQPGAGILPTEQGAANLALWNQVRTPDKRYAKDFNRGGFKGTMTNPTYAVRQMTEIFGPIGTGWGFEILDERYVEGAMLPVEPPTRAIIHVIRLQVWYHPQLIAGAPAISPHRPAIAVAGPHFGQTEFVGRNKNGVFTDEEAPKKSLTDALTKCLALLGVSADIHMGIWDDVKYATARDELPAHQGQQRQAPAPQQETTPVIPTEADVQLELDNLAAAIEGEMQDRINTGVIELRYHYQALSRGKATARAKKLEGDLAAARTQVEATGTLTWPAAPGPRSRES